MPCETVARPSSLVRLFLVVPSSLTVGECADATFADDDRRVRSQVGWYLVIRERLNPAGAFGSTRPIPMRS